MSIGYFDDVGTCFCIFSSGTLVYGWILPIQNGTTIRSKLKVKE